MARDMTSKERVIAALGSQEVDYVPMIQNFWMPHIIDFRTRVKWEWKTERERLTIYRSHGWDTYSQIATLVTPSADVKTATLYERDGDSPILHQIWHTPGGKIEERIRVTEDWPEAYNRTENIPLGHDFRTPRYVEMPFKDRGDLDTLEYLFPLNNPSDEQDLLKEYKEKKALSEEFGVPLVAYLDAGFDWFIWLFKAEEAVLLWMDRPDDAKRIMNVISNAKRQRLQMLLDLGIDAVIRRGFYESADFWSPRIFREYAAPDLSRDIEVSHQANARFAYLMMTGIMPLIAELNALKFDCLYGAEPVLTGQDQGVIRSSLPGKAMWGGISGPEHLSKGTPENTERAVEEAFRINGRTGFILGTNAGFRHNWSWENLNAYDRAWRRLR